MTASDSGGACRDAKEFYYDLISRKDADVPEPVRDHVASCLFCQQRIRCLREILSKTREHIGSGGSRTDSEIVEALSRHLMWLDQEVACRHVRPFLPSLVLLSSKIRIPTPITVHLDQCPPCTDDLAALRELNLTADQLGRLEGLYTACADLDPARCRQMRPAIAAFASLSLTGIDPEILDHLGRCPSCRAQVYRHRQRLAEANRQETALPRGACGREVSPAGAFDYVVPCGLAAIDADGMDRRRSEFAAHIRSCPACMDRLQTLHCTVYGILERADSGITTVYDMADDAEHIRTGTGDRAPRHPVGIESLHHRPQRVARWGRSAALGTRVRRAVAALAFRGNVTVILAAAVVLLLGILFFISVPTASGTNVGQILKAIEQVANVHITQFCPHHPEPVQEIWAARWLGKLVVKTGPECVLYDVNGGWKTTVTSDPETTTSVRMDQRERENCRTFLVGYAPAGLGNLPAHAKVRQLAHDASGESAETFDVYEISWGKRASGNSIVYYRWNIFVDPATALPQRIELFEMHPSKAVWGQPRITLFEYFAEREMRRVIEAMFP